MTYEYFIKLAKKLVADYENKYFCRSENDAIKADDVDIISDHHGVEDKNWFMAVLLQTDELDFIYEAMYNDYDDEISLRVRKDIDTKFFGWGEIEVNG